MAFFCHYNAPRYYIELKRNTIPRFSQVSNVSFAMSAAIYFLIGGLGYYTFGSNTTGFILNNYSQTDDLATACRFAIAVALTFTYPLPFIGTRDGILDLFSVGSEWQNSTNLNCLTVAMLAVFTALARKFTDLGLVNAIGGAAFGTAVVFLFPSIMFYCAVKNLPGDVTFWTRCESILVLMLMTIGIIIGTVGVIEVLSH
jgi:amino acid permease